jgi:hypothetical protein
VAVLTGANVIRIFGEGTSEYIAMFALRKVSAGDTYDLSAEFNPPLAGALLGTAGASAGASAVATFAGNVVTIPTGPSNSAGVLVVFGVHA